MLRCVLFILLLTLALLAGCEGEAVSTDTSTQEPPDGPPWFEDRAPGNGLDFVWDSGHTDRFFMPECIGGGGALFDYDGDGDLDAYLVQAGDLKLDPSTYRPSRLFENTGNGTFRDVTEGSGTDVRGYGMGAACGDVDNDGDVDLYVTNVGPNVLLRNDGGGRFTDVTEAAGVGDPDWGSSCAFFDYDRDGWLDLVVLNYVNWAVETETVCYNNFGTPDYCLPANYGAPGKSRLYRNRGDGTFEDVTNAAGMADALGTGLGVVCADFNGDHWPDMFFANDGMPDQLWLNRRDGTFIEFGLTLGVALDQEGKAKAGMGVTAADLDHDLDLDLLVCNLRYESDSLFLNYLQSDNYFRDATIERGISARTRVFTRFGVGFVDFDNDGELDLYQANGRVYQEIDTYADDVYAEPNMLFRGNGNNRFEEVRPRGGTASPLIHTSRAAVFGDIDNDGGMDIMVVNRDGPTYMLQNVVPQRGRWAILRLVDQHGRDAYGALVDVQAGGRVTRRDVRAGHSYLASNDPRVHFGLGDATQIDSIRVRWPDGTEERFDAPIDAVTTLVYGAGRTP